MAAQSSDREQRRSTQHDEEGADAPEAPVAQQQGQAQVAETDALLDEIDGVLEQNAEEFVHGFVQKGGQ